LKVINVDVNRKLTYDFPLMISANSQNIAKRKKINEIGIETYLRWFIFLLSV